MYNNYFQPIQRPLPDFPTVVIPQRVLTRMSQETMLFSATETGELVFGLELPGMLVVLGTIRDPEDVIRELGYFEHGGEDQFAIFKWIRTHWNAMRQQSRQQGQMTGWTPDSVIPHYHVPAELDADMHYIGDYHRHPGGYDSLSGKDTSTMFEILGNPKKKRNQYLAPLITLKSHVTQQNFQDAKLIVTTGSEIQIRFYYLVKGDDRIHEVKPVIVPDSHIPWIPPVPWHLTDLNRMRTELALFEDHGYQVQWGIQNVDDDPVHEILFWVDKPGWTKRLVIVTRWDYPQSMPEAYIVDLDGEGMQTPATASPAPKTFSVMKLVKRMLSFGKPKDTAENLFSRDKIRNYQLGSGPYLVDLVRDVEAQGGLDEQQPSVGQA